jgi:hypothetical protein
VLRQLKAPVGELMRQARLGRAIDTELVVPVVAEVAGSIQTHPSALLTLARIKVKNERAYMHAVAVCALMINLGRQLGLDQGSLRDLGMAGLLHDIGETALPSGLLDREIRLVQRNWPSCAATPSSDMSNWRAWSTCLLSFWTCASIIMSASMEGLSIPRRRGAIESRGEDGGDLRRLRRDHILSAV